MTLVDALILLAVLVVAIVLAAIFFRITFRLKRQLWNQKQQITSLLKIAKQLQVPDDKELQTIKTWNDNNSDQWLPFAN